MQSGAVLMTMRIEIHDFADRHGLDIHTLDTVKHMNADQATCGYGCSGNPYDAYWNFNPIGHGDIHELGHGLERSRFRYSDQQYMRDQNLTAWNQGAAINLQIMMAAQDLGLLENGYYLLARQHIIEREFNLADNNDADWDAKKDGLGFSDFTRDAARALSNNDWNLIALSHALDRDLSTYLERWGFVLSDAAKAAVAEKDDFPADFYIAEPQDHCLGFPTDKLPMDGTETWPVRTKPVAKPIQTQHHDD